ncbi:virion core protein, T7 gp14 family [Desulfovibrio litoralis]|uniref:Uncharacterized protein n=1 Tax=Desulfovibrio litoralis DSM 11393 TaxID=1121455 RepID=A0A1M7T873_9BACT|nr:hypothetical protein [Desulfovibrio litoralis]SHN66877.1 hypothetical protein SAMN02745728_01704 [Desulfovibrio litoralis DSM 11393]
MCSIPIAGLIITLASTAVSTASSIQQGKEQSKAAEAQARYGAEVASQEAATKEQLAKNEISKGIADRERHLRNAGRLQGEATSMLASNGFELDSGSTASMLAESASEAAYDANIITANAENAAWSHRVGATQAQNAQSSYLAQANNSKFNSGNAWLNGGASMLGAIGSGMAMYSQAKPTSTPAGSSYYDGMQDAIYATNPYFSKSTKW